MNITSTPRSSVSKKSPASRLLAAIATLSLVVAPSAYAANDVWIGNTDANFATLSNWTGSVSPNNNTPVFGAAGTAGAVLNNDLTGATYAGITFNSGASAFTIGGNAFTLNGNITNNSSSLQTINNAMTFGSRTFSGGAGGLALGGTLTSTTAITVNSGSVTFSGAASTIDGGAGNNSGFLTVSGNTALTIATGGSLEIKGTTGSKPNSIVGQNVTGTSTLLVNGGALTVGGNTGFVLGNSVTATDRTGVLTVSSGTATITAGSATLQNVQNFISMGRDNATGIINLDGGTLATGRQFVRDGSGGGTVGAGTATFNFNGGVLQAQANQTSGNGWFETATTGNFQVVTTTVESGGAKIDTNGFSTNINTVLAHDSGLGATADGGLAKSGAGTLTLGGASTYTGPTAIDAGTLALGAAGSISASSGVVIAAGAIFDTTAQSFTMSGGQTVSFNLDGGGSGSAGILQAAALNIGSGSVGFSVTGSALDDASYVLANYTSVAGVAFATVNNLPAGYTLDYNYLGGNQIALVAVPEPSAFAVIAGLAGLGAVGLRRRRSTRRSVGLIG